MARLAMYDRVEPLKTSGNVCLRSGWEGVIWNCDSPHRHPFVIKYGSSCEMPTQYETKETSNYWFENREWDKGVELLLPYLDRKRGTDA